MKIFISGLTAAGKTTHAKLLASIYHLQYISASSALLARANIDTNNFPKDFWVSPMASNLRTQRIHDRSIDTWVDQQMVTLATMVDDAIFDSWGLPWLSAEPGLRIWLESSNLSRWWKALISQGFDSKVDPDETLREIDKKDSFTREYFLSTYGFDLFHDHEIFDYILDISSFILAPTDEASKLSVKEAQKIISGIVHYHMVPDEHNFKNLRDEVTRYGERVFKKISPNHS